MTIEGRKLEQTKKSEDVMTLYRDWMKAALALAKKGAGFVAPNPMVGALVIDETEVIGRGYHERCGEGHAEVNAVADALTKRTSLAGMTMVVTLEPCSHYGKTPPCAELILKHGIKKVIIAMKDPNPLVAGRGTRLLENSGVEVVVGIMEEEARQLNEAFIHHILKKTPYVVMKTAMTLDGKIATTTGDSKWVSGSASRKYVHRLRQELQGIMVGVNTVIIDDPQLTTRLEEKLISHPVPIIVDSKGRMPLESKLLTAGVHQKVIIATTEAMPKAKEEALQACGCTIIKTATVEGRVDLNELMQILGAEGINSILLEGGGTLNDSALKSGIVQKILSFIAPKMIGGSTAKTPVAGTGIPYMADAILLKDMGVEQIGEDILVTAYIDQREEPTCLQDS